MSGLRELKRADSRAGTIDAAYRLFDERGYDGVTVADICAAAEIGRRTFFRYFQSKEELLAEPVAQMTARVAASIAAAPVAAADGALLRAAMTDLAEYVLAHRAKLELYRRIAATSATLRAAAFRHLPEQELRLAMQLHGRRRSSTLPDWRTRLLVARASAAFRVWLDLILDDLPVGRSRSDAGARRLLGQIFDADPWFG